MCQLSAFFQYARSNLVQMALNLILFVSLNSLVVSHGDSAVDLTLQPGHLKPFGDGSVSHRVDEIEGFPSISQFFANHVYPKRPLLMKNAGKNHPAYLLWEDEFLKEKNEDEFVNVETVKKERRDQEYLRMGFTEFINRYQDEELFIVSPIPPKMRRDIILPGPLQCDAVVLALVENLMWFSSGGTKSVIHTDAVDNINCVYRGSKTFVLVDPLLYGEQVPLDHPEGAYSSIDVDSVDYEKYPTLVGVEYYHVNMTEGDCLYLPFKWIHQVRSYNRNIAVNFWFDHRLISRERLADCSSHYDPSLSVDHFEFIGFDASEVLKNNLRDLVKQGVSRPADLAAFMEDMKDISEEDAIEIAQKAIHVLDVNGDGLLQMDDIENLNDQDLSKFRYLMTHFEEVNDLSELDAMFEADERERQREMNSPYGGGGGGGGGGRSSSSSNDEL